VLAFLFVINMKKHTFDEVWDALLLVNQEHNHCLSAGCGKRTLIWWMRRCSGERFTVSEVRSALKKAEELGYVVRGISNFGKYSTYSFVV
jgi:hypothetical protein